MSNNLNYISLSKNLFTFNLENSFKILNSINTERKKKDDYLKTISYNLYSVIRSLNVDPVFIYSSSSNNKKIV